MQATGATQRLIAVTFTDAALQETKIVTYTYDAFDRRIAKYVDENADGTPDREEHYVYDSTGKRDGVTNVSLDDVAVVLDETGAIKTRYLHGPAIDQVFASESATNEVLWSLADNQGTIRDWIDFDSASNTTSVVNHIKYDAFGNIVSVEDGSGNPSTLNPQLKDHQYAYTGREWDPDAELHYYRARWFDAQTGRFISNDPLGFAAADANLQRYVNNTALNNTDPSGLAGVDYTVVTSSQSVRLFIEPYQRSWGPNTTALWVIPWWEKMKTDSTVFSLGRPTEYDSTTGKHKGLTAEVYDRRRGRMVHTTLDLAEVTELAKQGTFETQADYQAYVLAKIAVAESRVADEAAAYEREFRDNLKMGKTYTTSLGKHMLLHAAFTGAGYVIPGLASVSIKAIAKAGKGAFRGTVNCAEYVVSIGKKTGKSTEVIEMRVTREMLEELAQTQGMTIGQLDDAALAKLSKSLRKTFDDFGHGAQCFKAGTLVHIEDRPQEAFANLRDSLVATFLFVAGVSLAQRIQRRRDEQMKRLSDEWFSTVSSE